MQIERFGARVNTRRFSQRDRVQLQRERVHLRSDTLWFGSSPGSSGASAQVQDVELYERCMQAQQMDPEDRAVIKRMIEALLASRQADQFAQQLATRQSQAS